MNISNIIVQFFLACVLGLAAAIASYGIIDQRVAVQDFVAGPAAYFSLEKMRDYGSVFTMILVSFASNLIFQSLLKIMQKKYGQAVLQDLYKGLWWIAIPAIAWLANALASGLRPNPDLSFVRSRDLLFVSAWLILPWGAAIFGFAVTRAARLDRAFLSILAAILAFCMFCALALPGVGILVSRLWPWLMPEFLAKNIVLFMYGAASIGLISVVAIFAWSRHPDHLLGRLISCAQFAALPLLAHLLPRWWEQGSGQYQPVTPITLELIVLLGMVAAAIIWDIARRMKHGALVQRISPAAFVPVIIAYISAYIIPHAPSALFILSDDYHFGEKISVYWALSKGAILHDGIVPPHGLISVLPFFLSDLLYQNVLELGVYAEQVAYALACAGVFLIVARYASVALGLLVVLLLPYNFQYQNALLQIGAIILAIGLYDRMRPARWLAFCAATLLCAVLLEPLRGTTLGLGLAIPFILKLRHAWKDDRAALGRWILAFIAAIGAISIFYPILNVYRHIFIYLLEQASINQAAYAGPWYSSWQTVLDGKSTVGWEILRFLWILAIPILATIAFNPSAIRAKLQDFNIRLFALSLICTYLPAISYYLGRIDMLDLSRTGIISIIIFGLGIPIILLKQFPGRPASLVFCAALIGISGGGFRFTTIKAAMRPLTPAMAQSDRDNPTLRLFGHAVLEPDHATRLANLRTLVDEVLSADETYLDLTNRSAHYAYLERAVPIALPAPYNMVHPNDQRRAVAALTKSKPPLVLLWADNILHDGGSTSLRTSLLYRWVVHNYRPLARGRFIIGLRPDRLEKLGLNETLSLASRTEAGWRNGIALAEAKITVTEPRTLAGLKPGDALEFPSSGIRYIQSINGAEVVLDKTLDAQKDNGGDIAVILKTTTLKERRLALWDAVFQIETLGFLPHVWGLSTKDLTKQMRQIRVPELLHRDAANFTYRISPAISGARAGYLTFSFKCRHRRGENDPDLTIHWPGQTQPLSFHAPNSRFVVPLEAYPGWLLNKKIDELTITINPQSACEDAEIEKLILWRRK